MHVKATEKPYHHGDLRHALIEAGIELINEQGVRYFSLRKVATRCGVSHAAPYAHFKDIDEMLAAMSEHVAAKFTNKLNESIYAHEDSLEIISTLGKAYITFFAENPNYFQFLFYHAGVSINLDDEYSSDYPPFALFREIAYRTFRKIGLPPEMHKHMLIARWALVHGIAALIANKNIHYSGDLRELLGSC